MLAPVVSSMLFILVFGLSLGGRIKQVGDVDYEVFIVPGLITMGMVQAAFANNASTIFQARFDRYINDVLSAPMKSWQMTFGYTIGGIVRALAIGVSLLVLAVVLVNVPIEHPFELALAISLGLLLFASLGLVVGIYAETWDHTSFIQNIVILPLTFVGGVFYSVDVLPSPWHELSHFNPIFYLVNARPLRLPRRERRVRLALARRDRGARDSGLRVGSAPVQHRQALEELEQRIVRCRRCPRLVEWREQVAREKRAAFAGEEYWGRPVPGFGDPDARVYVLGLAPAAHGGNRTGRVFTGDRSGDWLFASLYRTRLREPARLPPRGRRPRAPRRLDRRRRALRAAGEQAAARRSATTACRTRPRSCG